MAAGGRLLDGEVRAGGRVLRLLADALNVSILRLLARGPLPTPELPERVGPASRTTRFKRLRDLESLGVISREKRGGSPPVTYCMLSPSGAALLPVARRFAAWLNHAPDEADGRRRMADILAIKALLAGWSTSALRWLAEGPQTVTALASRASPQITYHDIRQARRSLAEAKLIEPVQGFGRGQPYALTGWGRNAVGPLAAAAKWERDFLPGDSGLFTSTEGETLLLLAISLVEVLPGRLSGICSLGLDAGHDIRVIVQRGRIVSSIPEAPNGSPCRVSGPPSAWLEVLLDGRRNGLEMRGSTPGLPAMLTAGLREACS